MSARILLSLSACVSSRLGPSSTMMETKSRSMEPVTSSCLGLSIGSWLVLNFPCWDKSRETLKKSSRKRGGNNNSFFFLLFFSFFLAMAVQ